MLTSERNLTLSHVMVEKLSSVRIMSPASLQTSVPDFPMATPMSALFRATASLVPSPVMATILPRDWRDWGETEEGGVRVGGGE